MFENNFNNKEKRFFIGIMRVLKKNGTVEPFSSTKAKKSIKLAMKASSGQYFPHLINAIVAELEDYVQKQDDPIDHAKIDKLQQHRRSRGSRR